MQKKFLLSFLLLMSFFVLFSAPVHAALVTNGGFEGSGDFSYQTLSAGSTVISGWTVTFGSIDWIKNFWKAREGSYSIDLSGNSLGQISQSFATIIGQQYKVTFSMAGNPTGGEAIKDLLTVIVGGAYSNIFSFDTTGKNTTEMGWTDQVFFFTALTPTATLQFTSLEGNAFGPALDDVSVAAIPIPTAAWLLGTGFVGLVVLKRMAKS